MADTAMKWAAVLKSGAMFAVGAAVKVGVTVVVGAAVKVYSAVKVGVTVVVGAAVKVYSVGKAYLAAKLFSAASVMLSPPVVGAGAGAAILVSGVWYLYQSRSSNTSDRQLTAQGCRGGGLGHAPSGDCKHSSDHHKSYKHHPKESQNLNTGVIKFMSYNVWFNEGLHLQERLAAIGCLVQQHEPDVIFFQEVTKEMYDIFQKSYWWKTYGCSISSEEVTKRNFCMLLTKLPAKESYCHAFRNSTMGRELCVAEIDVGMGQNLIVATSHLESPTPPEMHSKQRVAQAKMARHLLRKAPNVIFGGNMNWDEQSDGPFPLAEGWADAWRELRSGEEGWTYDTSSNLMLKLNRPLQKRLDRFICKLNNFRLAEIAMIGMDAIPGLLDDKNGKMLPVLPSDHYGLLLSIKPRLL